MIGNDFGSNVTAASVPTGYDAQMRQIDPRLGTSSPYSVCNVPGVGTFWFTSELNVAWLPLGQSVPRLIGNSLYSYRSDIDGINDTNRTALAQVVMLYHDLKLKLYLPVGGNNFSSVQFWLDLRPLMDNLASVLTQPSENIPAQWSGPHTGQSIRRVWLENQSGDAEALMGLEGDITNGLFVYELNPLNYSFDDVGASDSNAIDYWFKGHYWTGGAPGYVKALYNTLIDSQGYINLATVTVNDIHATVTNGFTILQLNGSAFSNVTYGNGFRYGTGTLYGQNSANNLGHVNYSSRATVMPSGDALQYEIRHAMGQHFGVNRILPQAKVEKRQPLHNI